MVTVSPPLVADREVLDDLLARLDATLDGASKEFAGLSG